MIEKSLDISHIARAIKDTPDANEMKKNVPNIQLKVLIMFTNLIQYL